MVSVGPAIIKEKNCARVRVKIDACDELHELGLQVSARSCQISYIPATTSGLKLTSWMFDGRKEKDCLFAPIKMAGIVTCSSWISRGIEQRRCCGDTLGNISLVRNLPATYKPSSSKESEAVLASTGCPMSSLAMRSWGIRTASSSTRARIAASGGAQRRTTRRASATSATT